MEATLWEAYRNPNVCDSSESVELIYKVAAVAGEAAVPSLRRLIDDKACSSAFTHDAVVTAVAKLGDDTALQRLAKMLDHDYPRAIYSLVRVGDDRAVRIMMTYFETHRSNALWRWDYDVWNPGVLTLIAGGIGGGANVSAVVGTPIAERRTLPDLPTFPSTNNVKANEFKQAWINWWEMHKGSRLSLAPYESVSDPYLQCLAREVDWDIPAALLAIADHGGAEAEAVLRIFPPPTKSESVGTVQGNLSVALAKLGDPKEFARIVEKGAINAPPRTLEYIGGRKAAEALVGALLSLSEHASLKVVAMANCIQKYYPNADKTLGERACEKSMTSDRELEAQQSDLLSRLSRMVKNAPLPTGVAYTTQNIEKWRDWWAKNKDTAEFVSIPFNQLN
jgi:hypothetical protein